MALDGEAEGFQHCSGELGVFGAVAGRVVRGFAHQGGEELGFGSFLGGQEIAQGGAVGGHGGSLGEGAGGAVEGGCEVVDDGEVGGENGEELGYVRGRGGGGVHQDAAVE